MKKFLIVVSIVVFSYCQELTDYLRLDNAYETIVPVRGGLWEYELAHQIFSNNTPVIDSSFSCFFSNTRPNVSNNIKRPVSYTLPVEGAIDVWLFMEGWSWSNTTASDGQDHLVYIYISGGGGQILQFIFDHGQGVIWDQGSNRLQPGDWVLASNTWHHLGTSWKSNGFMFAYTNNILASSRTLGNPGVLNGFILGGYQGNTSLGWGGLLDGFKQWSTQKKRFFRKPGKGTPPTIKRYSVKYLLAFSLLFFYLSSFERVGKTVNVNLTNTDSLTNVTILNPGAFTNVTLINIDDITNVTIINTGALTNVTVLNAAAFTNVIILNPGAFTNIQILNPEDLTNVEVINPEDFTNVEIINPDELTNVTVVNPAVPTNAQEWVMRIADRQDTNRYIVHKFGGNDSVTTTLQAICHGGDYQMPTNAQPLQIASDDNLDHSNATGLRKIRIEGLGENWEVITNDVFLQGTTNVILPSNFLRVYRLYGLESGSYGTYTTGSQMGGITLQNTNGVDTWAVLPEIETGIGSGQSQITAFTVPAGWKAYICSFFFMVDSGKTVNLYLLARFNADNVTASFDPTRMQNEFLGVVGSFALNPDTPIGPFPSHTDIVLVGQTSSGTAAVTSDFEIILERE